MQSSETLRHSLVLNYKSAALDQLSYAGDPYTKAALSEFRNFSAIGDLCFRLLGTRISFRILVASIGGGTNDTAEGCGDVEVTIDRAPAKDIRRDRAVDPKNTRKLLALVRKNDEPPYRGNRCRFAAILKRHK